MIYSNFQKNIFKAVTDTNSNILVSATAGSGKTTTILEALKLIPKFKDTIFVSFSNTIVDTLKERVPSYVRATTLHALGFSIIQSHYKGVKFNQNKYFQLALDSYPKKEINKETFRNCFIINDIINYMRMTLTPPVHEKVVEMCNYYSIDWDEGLIEKSIELLETPRKLKSVDFADMIYIPATNHGIIDRCYDYIFLDECQDSNNAQIQFIEGLLKLSGRLIAVGDKRQAIYSFTGSSIDSFEKFEARPNTLVLPLSVSYRCGKKVVANAQEIYPEIQPYENNHDGEVRRGTIGEVNEGDVVLSRNNAPLISIYFHLLSRDKKCHIIGKEIEKGIISLIESILIPDKKKFIDNLVKKLEKLEKELKKKNVSKPKTHPRYRALFEKVEVILLILAKVEGPKQLIPKIKEIFHESKEGIKLMTVHKSKGTENNRIFLLDRYNGDRLMPSKYAQSGWQIIQERNLIFVAYTRSKNSLIHFDYVDDE